MVEEKVLRAELVRVSKEAYTRGLVSAAGGNISARISNTNKVLIKPTGLRLCDLTPKRLIVVDLKEKIVKGKGKPSKEIKFHVGIYKVRKDVGAVLHTHSPAVTAFAVVGRKLPLITAQAIKLLGEVPLVGYAPSGSAKLAKLVVNTFKKRDVKAAVLQGHGSIVVGATLAEAFNNADLLEETAKTAILAFQLGKPRRIPR